MKTKKFAGATLKEATARMKHEVGEDAIILSTRVVNDEKDKKLFEIVCGIEDELEEIDSIVADREEKFKNSYNNRPNQSTAVETYQDSGNSFISPPKMNRKGNTPVLREELQTVIDTLKAREINKDIIQLVMNYLKKSKQFLTLNNLDNFIITSLSSLINTREFSIDQRQSGKVISIVGPTGVGKTTCIAKLAAISKIIHNLDIGIISIDTYRLGAIDQLRIFSEISNVDMLVAYEPGDMPKLIEKLKNKDLIFIDTTGRSQRNTDELEKMSEFFKDVKVDETYLALSMTSSTKTLQDAAEKFQIFNYDSFLFTKIDEAVACGNLLNISVKHQKPVIYLTNGQTIPDDIIAADAEFIAKMIYYGNHD